MENGKVVINGGGYGSDEVTNNHNNGAGLNLALWSGSTGTGGVQLMNWSWQMPGGGGVGATSSSVAAIRATPPYPHGQFPPAGIITTLAAPGGLAPLGSYNTNNMNNVTLALPAAELMGNHHQNMNMNTMMMMMMMMMMRNNNNNNGVGVGVGVEAELRRMSISRPEEEGRRRQLPRMQRVAVSKWSEEGEREVAATGVITDFSRPQHLMIVCVCHLHCFTPSDFVYHAIGCRVQDPLRHITVLPPFFFDTSN